MTYLREIGNGFSQLLNALAGGNSEISMSARTGYLALHDGGRWFLFLQKVIDTTFYPIDGIGHCFDAFVKDSDHQIEKGSTMGLAFMSLFALIGCCFVMPLTWRLKIYSLPLNLIKSIKL